MYEKQDLWRTKKWALANPKVAEKQNIEQLKKLIVINLTKPRQKPQPVKGYDSSPILTLAEIRRRKLAKRTKQNFTDGEHDAETAMNASMSSSIQMAKTKQKQLQPRASPPRIQNKKVYDLDSVNDDEVSNRIERDPEQNTQQLLRN
jgi:hypothetical protein